MIYMMTQEEIYFNTDVAEVMKELDCSYPEAANIVETRNQRDLDMIDMHCDFNNNIDVPY